MVGDILRVLFGGGGNVVRETAEVFRVNAEAADARAAAMQRAALDQMAAEFRPEGRGLFDRVIDALNRLPRRRSRPGCARHAGRRRAGGKRRADGLARRALRGAATM